MPGPWDDIAKSIAGQQPKRSVTVKLPPPAPINKKKERQTPSNTDQRNYANAGPREYVEEAPRSGVRGVVEGVTGLIDMATDPVLSTAGRVAGGDFGALGQAIAGMLREPDKIGQTAGQFPVTQAANEALDTVIGPEETVADPALNLTKRGFRLGGNLAVPVGPISGGRALPHVIETLAGTLTGLGGGEIAARTAGEEARGAGELIGSVPGIGVAAVASRARPPAKRFSVMPVPGARVSSGFGPRTAPTERASTNHMGVDLAAPEGSPVVAPEAGVVKATGSDNANGNWVEIDHGGGITTKYLHLSRIGVKKGDKLNARQPFAKVGSTGIATGPNLHWAAYKDGKPIDPLTLKGGPKGSASSIPPEQIARIMDDPDAALRLADDERIVDGRLKVGDEVSDSNNVEDLTARRTEQVQAENDPLIQENLDFANRVHLGIDQGVITPRHLPNIQGAIDRIFGVMGDFEGRFSPSQIQQMKATIATLDEAVQRLGGEVLPREGIPSAKPPRGDAPVETANTNLPDLNDVPVPERTRESMREQIKEKGLVRALIEDERGSVRGYSDDSVEPTPPHRPVVAKLIEGISRAKTARGKQNVLYSEERSARLKEMKKVQKYTGGEAGFYAEKAALKGAMKEADYDSIREHFNQGEIDELHDIIKHHNASNDWDKIRARDGLQKMLDGKIPNDGEIKILSDIFPDDMIQAFKKHQPSSTWANILNIPRTAMSTADLSAPFRQGLFLINRGDFWKNLGPMLKYFANEGAFQASMKEIRSRPTYGLMKDADLALTDMGSNLSQREEAFMSNLVEKIPVYGRLVRASNRAHVGFLNRLRADTFDSMVRDGQALGINWETSPNGLKELGYFINAATGRGNLPGMIKSAAPLLNGVFFAPRLVMSRIQLLSPKYYLSTPFLNDPAARFVRKEAIKSLITLGGVLTTVLTLASIGGAEVETDLRASDFAKIKVGNTRYDITGGFSPYVRLVARLITGVTKTAKGKTIKLGEDYGAKTALDISEDFFHSKESPIASFVTDYLRGSDVVGNKFELTNFEDFDAAKNNPIVKRLFPMYFQDTVDAVQEHGLLGPIISSPGIVGASVQTYEPKKSKAKGRPKKTEWDKIAEAYSQSAATPYEDWEF